LYAIGLGRRVGIDVEYVCPDLANEGLAENFFAPAEAAAIRALPPHMQPEAFFTRWTRKEAYLKALGKGLSAERLSSIELDSNISGWTFSHLAPGPEHVGTLAAEGCGVTLACWQWPDGGMPPG
jgi:4'-phosphopantetheinyl transferase